MAVTGAAKGQKTAKRLAKLRRAQTDSWYLATEILGYGWNPKAGEFGKGLTEWLHKPLCEWYDRFRDEHYRGLFMSRWHHKTTLVVVWEIQEQLRDPTSSAFYFHAVDENASEFVSECGHHWQHNERLRELDPVLAKVMVSKTEYEWRSVLTKAEAFDVAEYKRVSPMPQAKRWLKTDQYSLTRPKDRPYRFPTLFGKGAGSEITGKHASRAWPDDIIGRRTIVNNMLPHIKGWWQDTVMPVVDDRKFFVIGTRWHYEALYEQWIKSKKWRTIVLPASIPLTDGKDFFEAGGLGGICDLVDQKNRKIWFEPDYTLKNPVYGTPETKRKQIAKLRDLQGDTEMGKNFNTQIMNDPLPEADRVWQPEQCEHFVNLREIKPQKIIVLCDPAPRGDSPILTPLEKQRGDGSKDDWANAVIAIERRKDLVRYILLDGAFSKDWTDEEGCRNAAELQTKWHTPYVGFDEIGRKWGEYHRRVCIKFGAKFSWVKLTTLMRGKFGRIKTLAGKAEHAEFLISMQCPPAFRDQFLSQMRLWPQVRYDDCADAVAMCMDDAVLELAPSPISPSSPFDEMDDDMEIETYRSRYCAI